MDEQDYIYYETVEGDTYDSIAFEFYTEEKLAHRIIEANPEHADVIVFEGDYAAVTLKIPVIDEYEDTPDGAPPWRVDEK